MLVRMGLRPWRWRHGLAEQRKCSAQVEGTRQVGERRLRLVGHTDGSNAMTRRDGLPNRKRGAGAHFAPMSPASDALKCCQCGQTNGVKLYSPDMDIEPVPLCVICWFEILSSSQQLGR
jgi:hypothetical protein